MGVFFSCKHFPQTSLCATRRSECSGAISLRFDNKACDTTIFVILRHAAIHTRNPHKTHSVSMRPLCEILLDDCSIKATSCDVEFFFNASLWLTSGWDGLSTRDSVQRREEDATRQLCHEGFVSQEANTGLLFSLSAARDRQPRLRFISAYLQRCPT